MEERVRKKQSCRICGGKDFYKDAGYFYCETCQTQNEDVREEVFEMRVDATTRVRKVVIKKPKVKLQGEDLGWTSWELYNFVLIGLTDEVIELGASPNIKLTVLQLWATYLGKLEVAFTSRTKKDVPRLSRAYNKKDAEIFYGKTYKQKKRKSRSNKSLHSTNSTAGSGYQSDCSSSRMLSRSKKLLVKAEYNRYLQSQASSDNDVVSTFSQSGYSSRSKGGVPTDGEERIQFNKRAKQETKRIKKMSKSVPAVNRTKYIQTHVTTQYRMGPEVITVMKLWAIIYLALIIHNEPIQLGDLLRYAREGHMSYYRLDHLLPPEVKLTQKDMNLLSQYVDMTHKGMRRTAARMATFIGIDKINCPDLLPLISRYCQELALPRGVLLYTERLIALSPPTMIFDSKKSCIPNYEARAMAYIIVVLKVLFGLDGITEHAISKVAELINVQDVICNTLENETCNKSKKFFCQTDSSLPCIIVHGGIGHCKDFGIVEKITACKKAACNGYKKLMSGASSVEAVETALWWLECDEFFNCGYGSVLNEIGQVEMDASIMDGEKFECGSVAAVSDIEHPISLARYVLENLPNTIIVGESCKPFAQCANINWLLQGNMIAPTAYLAYKLSENGKYVADYDIEELEHIHVLQKSTGTVGCVAWNGYSIASGTTTGGLNRKMVGRVGDSPFLGCGTYADKYVGCSLTGHGESIIKLGMARRIAEDINSDYDPRTALQRNFDYMLDKCTENGGGIVLKRDGSWGVYFTCKRMPYAVVKDDMITFGIDLNEQKAESYKEFNDNKYSTKQGVLDKKLFNFYEWQRYIECRKNILANVHLPTKLKHNPNVPSKSYMYFKFLEDIKSKKDGELAEITDYKHLLPRELSTAMKQCTEDLNQNDVLSEEHNTFAPSLTPFHSYLQELLDDSTNQIPDILRNDFYVTKVGYTTNIQAFKELAMQCNINLEIIDSSAHFIDKIVPYFEPSKIANLPEFTQKVKVREYIDVVVKSIENFVSYMDKNIPCYIRINDKKLQHFDNAQDLLRSTTDLQFDDRDDFGFKDVLPNGKLLIPEENDSEFKSNILDHRNGSEIKNNCINAKKEVYKKYVTLTNAEEETMFKPQKLETVENFLKRKMHMFRDSKGKFIKASQAHKLFVHMKSKETNEFNIDELHNFTGLHIDSNVESGLFKEVYDEFAQQYQDKPLDNAEYTNYDSLSNVGDVFNLSDISILCEDSLDKKSEILSRTFPLNDITDTEEHNSNHIRFYQPFTDYWMYNCVFSRVKGKNFELFEKVLPRSFRWLLNECANTVEVTMEDLYEEICTIESFHSQILNSNNLHDNTEYPARCTSRFHRSLVISKW